MSKEVQHPGPASPRDLREHLAQSWGAEEDRQLVLAVKRHGQKWRLIEKQFPNRGNQQVRCRWYRLQAGKKAADLGMARNRCRKCGELKRGHVCTSGFIVDKTNKTNKINKSVSDVTATTTDTSSSHPSSSDEEGEDRLGRSEDSSDEEEFEVRASSPCNISEGSAAIVRLEPIGSIPNTETRKLLLSFIRTSKISRGAIVYG